MYTSLPSPGPITHAWIRLWNLDIVYTHLSCIFYNYYEQSCSSSSCDDFQTGWTIIYGVYVFIGIAAAWAQNKCTISAPIFRADMAA